MTPDTNVLLFTYRDGTDFDIYGGRDGCESRALSFGRQHLTVEVAR